MYLISCILLIIKKKIKNSIHYPTPVYFVLKFGFNDFFVLIRRNLKFNRDRVHKSQTLHFVSNDCMITVNFNSNETKGGKTKLAERSFSEPNVDKKVNF